MVRKYKEYEAYVSKLFGYSVGLLRLDRGGEYESNAMDFYLKSKGTLQDITPRHTPQLNSVPKRMNRTIAETSATLLIESNLPSEFIGDAIKTAVYLRNRCSTRAIPNGTPFEKFLGKKPQFGYLKIFCCEAWAYIPAQLRQKFDVKSTKCIMLGYCC